MKKQIYFLVSLLALIGFSMNVSAQSTYEKPYPGATHTYKVNAGVATSGSTYTWSVSKTTLAGDASGDYTMTNGANAATISILWGAGVTEGTVYYVKVIEENAGCKNVKILPVTIQASNFYVSIKADKPTSCYTTDITTSLSGSEPQYDHGYADLVYTITPTNFQTKWKFDFNCPAPSNDYSVTVPTAVTSGDATITGNTVTATSATPIKLTFRITRTVKLTNGTDAAGTAANFTGTVTVSNGYTGASFGTKDLGINGTYSDQTAVSRPATTTITGE